MRSSALASLFRKGARRTRLLSRADAAIVSSAREGSTGSELVYAERVRSTGQ
jgi:hypothetical protein